jgi:hypothetical protein
VENRSHRNELILGVVTVLPLVAFVLLFVVMWFAFSHVERGVVGAVEENDGSLPWIPIAVVAGLAMTVLALGLQAFYGAHAYRRATPAHRWFWIVFVVLGQVFAMPVYWYFNVWQRRSERS